MDFRRVCAVILVAGLSGCGGAPTTPSESGTSASSPLRITGLPAALTPGTSAQLTALVGAQGAGRACAASWSVDNLRAAEVSSTGELTGLAIGYVTVTASCEGVDARGETRVTGPAPANAKILAYDRDVRSVFGVAATMQFLDGPRVTQLVETEPLFPFQPRPDPLSGIQLPVKVRFTAEDYAPREVVLAEPTDECSGAPIGIVGYCIPMTFVGNAQTDTDVRTMSRDQGEFVYPFRPARTGQVRVRTWWSVDFGDGLFVELWCGGIMLRRVEQSFGSAGDGFTELVPSGTACEVRLRQVKNDAGTHFRVAITYPHEPPAGRSRG
jgi:hypothetical protein